MHKTTDRKVLKRVGPKQRIHKELYFWSSLMDKWSILFPFADSAVVSSSQGIKSALLEEQNATNDRYIFYIFTDPP